MEGLDEEVRSVLEDPRRSLLAYGTVGDQSLDELQRYDPGRVTKSLQQTIISYAGNPPRDDNGFTKWLVVLASRQSGKSTASSLAFLPKVMYRNAWRHMTIADDKKRADDLHERITLCYDHWAEEIRTPRRNVNEIRSLSLENHSKMSVHSANSEAVGIGRGVSSLVASELAFWDNAELQWSLLQPAMFNRKNSLIILECTPATLGTSSASWWKDRCDDARRGEGRFIFKFAPFWDSKLCRRPWPKGSEIDSEERALLERYAHLGLELENLAFRREYMATDTTIRRHPELFGVFYPFDMQSCWVSGAGSVIPSHAFRRLPKVLREEPEGYHEFEPPKHGSEYLIGVDPAGYGARDHASFQVLEMWHGEWRQVAVFGDVIDPNEFATKLFETGIRYNKALIAIERNGVGSGCIQALRLMGYPRLFHDAKLKPGLWNSSHEQMMSILIDSMMDELILVGEDTIGQLKNYQSDKAVERAPKAELMGGDAGLGKRRKRHHWDKVSALMVACVAARAKGWRHRPSPPPQFAEIRWDQMTWSERQRYAKMQRLLDEEDASRARRSHYRRGR